MKSDELRNQTTVLDRRTAVENHTGVSLSATGAASFDSQTASSRNCENMIGWTAVPVGVAGPLHLRSDAYGERSVFVPLATTEGALVASVNRGMKAIGESGGATVYVDQVGATRGPVFRVSGIRQAREFQTYVRDNLEIFRQIATTTSSHLSLLRLTSKTVGSYVYIRFSFDTKDAMGLNMATIATDAIARHITDQTGIHCVSLSGNFCADKKPAWINSIEGRGTQAWAEVCIPGPVVESVLKTTPPSIYDVWFSKCMLGSAVSGAMSYTAHAANVVAALFLSTGQDIAHVTEGCVGYTVLEPRDTSLYASVHLPDLLVGTVGGGTGLPTQHEALTLLGVAGGDDGKNKERFAEIVAGSVLAGELSLLASLSDGSLARSHARLARGKGFV